MKIFEKLDKIGKLYDSTSHEGEKEACIAVGAKLIQNNGIKLSDYKKWQERKNK